MTTLKNTAYLDGLRMLARRELSEAQMRQRLARRGHDDEAIDGAVARLIEERALDDRRVAEAIARLETGIKGRGRHRVRRRIEEAGIPPAIARLAIDSVFEHLDDDAMLAEALEKRLSGRAGIEDDREAQRLYRALLAQGFDSDRILRAISSRRRR
ncbi:MAG: regulatory protein RecX [Vicinamibacterales bacterium]